MKKAGYWFMTDLTAVGGKREDRTARKSAEEVFSCIRAPGCCRTSRYQFWGRYIEKSRIAE
jgi:hypothetical protein